MKKNKIWILIVFIVTVLILYFVLKEDFYEITKLVFQANFVWILIGFLLVAGYSFFKGLIITDIVKQFKKDFKFKRGFLLQVMTNFFNGATPFSSGGQPFQVYILKKEGLSIMNGTSIILQESIIHQWALILTGILSFIINLIFNFSHGQVFVKNMALLGLLMNFVMLVVYMVAYWDKSNKIIIHFIIEILAKLKLVKNKDLLLEKWNDYIVRFKDGTSSLMKNKKRFIKLIGLNMIGLITLYIVPLTVLFSLGDFTSFNGINAIVMANFVALIGSYIPLPGGSGGQEYAFLLLFGLFISNPLLSSLMLIWRFLTYYLPLIIGAVTFNFYKEAS